MYRCELVLSIDRYVFKRNFHWKFENWAFSGIDFKVGEIRYLWLIFGRIPKHKMMPVFTLEKLPKTFLAFRLASQERPKDEYLVTVGHSVCPRQMFNSQRRHFKPWPCVVDGRAEEPKTTFLQIYCWPKCLNDPIILTQIVTYFAFVLPQGGCFCTQIFRCNLQKLKYY